MTLREYAKSNNNNSQIRILLRVIMIHTQMDRSTNRSEILLGVAQLFSFLCARCLTL